MDSARTPELIHAEPLDVSEPRSEIRFLRHPIKFPSMADLRTQVIASTSGVALATLTLNPLVIVKVRQQALDRAHLPSISSIVRYVYVHEGIRAFWRGAGTSFAMAAPTTGVYMVCYEASKDIFANSLFPAHMSAAAPAAAAFVSRGFTATLSTPLEVVKTRQQDGSTNSALTELRSIYQKTGMRGCFSGLGPLLARDAPYSAVYWGLLEATKGPILANQGIAEKLFTEQNKDGTKRLAAAGTFVASVNAAIWSSIITHPFDVVKTRVQTSARLEQSSWDLAVCIVKKDGPRVLFRGLGMRLLSLVPSSSLMVTTYELVKRVSKDRGMM